jgi:kynurenine 3-monooxygenase
MAEQRIALIGGGLAGPLLSIYLAKRGFNVDVYERRSDMRRSGSMEGRSINLALSTRGIHALREVGLDREILNLAIPMKGRMMHALDGKLTFQPYGKDESEVIYSISRAQLNIALMDAAERTGQVAFHFQARCTGMDVEAGELRLRDETTKKEYFVRAAPIIGADGSASALRESLKKSGRLDYSETYLEHGYKELTIPAGSNGKFLMEPNALHIWPRKTFMLIALPNVDGSFTCILFYPFSAKGAGPPHRIKEGLRGSASSGKGKESFETLDTFERVHEFFQKQFPDALMLMPSLTENFFANPTGSMVTVRSFPWHVEGKVLLLGDSSHAIVPFFGQGMNCAFEDCTVFNECLGTFGSDWERVFQEFEKSRKPNCDAIAEMALENFIEMRDLVADPKFLFRKKVELELEKRFPSVFISRYGMVTFHRIPYAIALERGKVQDKILSELCDGIESIEEVDWRKAKGLVGGLGISRRIT